MRRFINIVESFGWEREIETSYAQFQQRWEDHVEVEMIDEIPVLTFEEYVDHAYEIAEELSHTPLYRGIKSPLSVLEGDGHLGVHWSRALPTAHDFAKSGWGNRYDDRFTQQVAFPTEAISNVMATDSA